MRAKRATKLNRIRVLLVGWLVFLLSGCTSTFISYPLLDSTRIQKYECGTIPKLGNFFEYSVGNKNNMLLYSYDADNRNNLIGSKIEIFDIDIKTKESKNILSIPTQGQKITNTYYEYLCMYEDTNNQEITILLDIIEGNQSNIYKITKEQKVLLFSYPKPIYWSRFGIMDSANDQELDKMYLFFQQPDYYDVFLISLTEPFVYKNLKLSLALKSFLNTKDFLYAIEKEKNENKILCIEKNTFTYQYISYYPDSSFVGSIYKDNIALACDHRNNLIEILSPKGIIGTFPSPVYQENLETILVKKYPTYFAMFAIPKSTSYGIDNQCVWLRYYPSTKQVKQSFFTLPKQLDYYFTDSYVCFSHEVVGLGLNHTSRESYLVFFYFNNGKVQFERIQHQNVGFKCEKGALMYWPKERVFTWRERYYESDTREYKNFLFYCNLNRFQNLLSRYKPQPGKIQN
ncbi:hypothetical protein LLG10_08605 [bacterium]|nr:hypothetical protein [bacterium]